MALRVGLTETTRGTPADYKGLAVAMLDIDYLHHAVAACHGDIATQLKAQAHSG